MNIFNTFNLWKRKIDTLISFSSSLSSIGHQKIRSDVYSFRSKKIFFFFFFRYGMLLALPGTYHHWCASERVNRVAFNMWKTFFAFVLCWLLRVNLIGWFFSFSFSNNDLPIHQREFSSTCSHINRDSNPLSVSKKLVSTMDIEKARVLIVVMIIIILASKSTLFYRCLSITLGDC